MVELFVYQYSTSLKGHNYLFCVDEQGVTSTIVIQDLPQYIYIELPQHAQTNLEKDIPWETGKHAKELLVKIIDTLAEKVYQLKAEKNPSTYRNLPHYTIVRKRKIYGANLRKGIGKAYNNVELLSNENNELITCDESEIYPEKIRENMKNLGVSYELFPFIKLEIKNSYDLNIYKKVLDANKILEIDVNTQLGLKYHGMNVDPIMRLMNQCNLPAYGWVHIENFKILANRETIPDNKVGAALKEIQMRDELIKNIRMNPDTNPSRCTHCYNVSYKDVHKSSNISIPGIIIGAFDIENNVTGIGAAKNAYNPNNAIFSISIVYFCKKDPNKFIKHLHMIRGKIPKDKEFNIPHTQLWLYEGENAQQEEVNLLKGFIQDLIDSNVNILIGYNSNSYDLDYVYKRCDFLSIKGILSKLSYINYEEDVTEKKINLETSARGFNEFYELSLKGIAMLDVLQYFKAEHRFPEYKLKYVAKEILQDKQFEKDPVTLAKICESYASRTPELLYELGKYNVQDSFITLLLFLKCNVLEFVSELANIARIPVESVYLHGQQKRIRSLIYYYCLNHNHIYENTSYLDLEQQKYIGAINLQPEIEDFFDTFIFDFASLYPSIIQAKNLDYSTYVDKEIGFLKDISCNLSLAPPNKYSEIKDAENLGSLCHIIHVNEHQHCIHAEKIFVEASQIIPLGQIKSTEEMELNDIDEEHIDKTITKNACFEGQVFVCTNTTEKFLRAEIFGKGIMPSLVEEFLTKRRETRKKKEKIDEEIHRIINENKEDGEENYHLQELKHLSVILDKKQLALKVCANSIYGATGTGTHGSFPFVRVARSITAVGRKNIMVAKKFMEIEKGIDVIYGDTDSILCREKNGKRLKQIKDENGNPTGIYDVKSFFEKCRKLQDEINKNFESPMKMEFEGVVYHYILFTAKKHYVTLLLGEDGKIDKPKEKGVLSVRRDVCQYAKEVFKEIYMLAMSQKYEDIELTEEDIVNHITQTQKEAIMKLNDMIAVYMDAILKMYGLRVDRDSLSISKTLRDQYKSKPVHSFVADRMQERGEEINAGDRVKYMLIRGSILSSGVCNKQANIADSYQHVVKWGEYLPLDLVALHRAQFVSQFDQIFNVIAKRAKQPEKICERIYQASFAKAKLLDQYHLVTSPNISLNY